MAVCIPRNEVSTYLYQVQKQFWIPCSLVWLGSCNFEFARTVLPCEVLPLYLRDLLLYQGAQVLAWEVLSAGKIVTVCSCGMNTESAKLAPFQTQITHISNVFYQQRGLSAAFIATQGSLVFCHFVDYCFKKIWYCL